ncbi:MAG TPA: hypothetical protein DHV86_02705 [Methylophilaceae bacterium]|nr:hypothetical protein [Methylophilaceae bacterium]
MNRIAIKNLEMDGLKLLSRQMNVDSRGAFGKIFSSSHLEEEAWNHPIRQINLSHTKEKGTIRGMHIQSAPMMEAKIVSCLKGAIWDVALDLRKNSATFLQWHAEILSEDNFSSLVLPIGFAHGFQALTPNVEMIYIHSHDYSQDKELGVHYLDPTLNIAWPEEITVCSERDMQLPALSDQLIKELNYEM